MNKKITYIGILAAIPLLLIAASPSLLITSEAVNTSVFDGGSAQTTYHYGIRTQATVCGDHLCNEHQTVSAVNPASVQTDVDVPPEDMPKIKILQANNYRGHEPNAYIVTIEVTAGKANLKNIVVHVVSDVGANGGVITSLFALDDTKLVVRMNAMDPASIHASVGGYHVGR